MSYLPPSGAGASKYRWLQLSHLIWELVQSNPLKDRKTRAWCLWVLVSVCPEWTRYKIMTLLTLNLNILSFFFTFHCSALWYNKKKKIHISAIALVCLKSCFSSVHCPKVLWWFRFAAHLKVCIQIKLGPFGSTPFGFEWQKRPIPYQQILLHRKDRWSQQLSESC